MSATMSKEYIHQNRKIIFQGPPMNKTFIDVQSGNPNR